MGGSLGRAAAVLLRWGRGAGGGLRGLGVRAASLGGSGSSGHLAALVLKGTPEQPQCGFSNAVVQILRLHGVRDYAAYNVLDDPQLRQGQSRLGAGAGAGAGLGGDRPRSLCGVEGLSGKVRPGARGEFRHKLPHGSGVGA
ncbi:glutaredoxin-related protein 5, mitochondrial-like [Mesoplodon densirostris]|uniref:glutaredoxin-related protein 5, mitochondrial-like n=1 Tax=Mesoplodon densirostris TaxID=48708 RepID=UPI0028DCB9AE|nr:glutaredoxin-related protein 5, mitochondrial-like [Mesoplodon densirostris]